MGIDVGEGGRQDLKTETMPDYEAIWAARRRFLIVGGSGTGMTFYDPLNDRTVTVHNVAQWINDRTESPVSWQRVAAGQWGALMPTAAYRPNQPVVFRDDEGFNFRNIWVKPDVDPSVNATAEPFVEFLTYLSTINLEAFSCDNHFAMQSMYYENKIFAYDRICKLEQLDEELQHIKQTYDIDIENPRTVASSLSAHNLSFRQDIDEPVAEWSYHQLRATNAQGQLRFPHYRYFYTKKSKAFGEPEKDIKTYKYPFRPRYGNNVSALAGIVGHHSGETLTMLQKQILRPIIPQPKKPAVSLVVPRQMVCYGGLWKQPICQQCENRFISALSEEEAQDIVSTLGTCVRFGFNANGHPRSGFSTALIFGSAIAMGCGDTTTATSSTTTAGPELVELMGDPEETLPPTGKGSSALRAMMKPAPKPARGLRKSTSTEASAESDNSAAQSASTSESDKRPSRPAVMGRVRHTSPIGLRQNGL